MQKPLLLLQQQLQLPPLDMLLRMVVVAVVAMAVAA